jgi:hypothetical protein
MKRMSDLDKLSIEQIIQLPFFLKLEKTQPNLEKFDSAIMWKITFRCNRLLGDGMYGLLDESFESELVVRFKIIEFKTT